MLLVQCKEDLAYTNIHCNYVKKSGHRIKADQWKQFLIKQKRNLAWYKTIPINYYWHKIIKNNNLNIDGR